MIGGHDISYATETPEQVFEGAVRIVRAAWGDAVLENAETGEIMQNGFPHLTGLPAEILIYKNAESRASWTAQGMCEENVNLMVQLLRDNHTLTLVVDDPAAPEMSMLIKSITEHVTQDIFQLLANAA